MRQCFTKSVPMPDKDFKKLFQNAEVARCSIHLLSLWPKVGTPTSSKKDLREEVVKEIKALRMRTEAKEDKTLPKLFHQEITRVLWDQ